MKVNLGTPLSCSPSCSKKQWWERYKKSLLILLLLFLPYNSYATLIPMAVDTPCTNADAPSKPPSPFYVGACYDTVGATRLTDLASILIYGRRCGQSLAESTFLGTIPALGLECSTINFDLDVNFDTDTLAHTAFVYALAKDTSGHVSCLARGGVTIAVPASAFESGVWGAYFGAMDFTHFAYTRKDLNIDFAWGETGPGAPMPTTEYSVRWTGKLRAPVTGIYQFRIHVKDGERLNVAGVQVTDNWVYQYAHDDIGSVSLTGGFSYPIILEYLSHWGGSEVHLYWTKPGSVEELVPPSALEQP